MINWMPIFAKPKSWQANILDYQNQGAKVLVRNLDIHLV
jgi:outer membrane biogenesis lipoprotein LolB